MTKAHFPAEVSAVVSHIQSGVTVLVPAYNEAASIADTIDSLNDQTIPPAEIIVIDDCSTDNTAEVARALGATVIRPAVNTGSKAGAQNYALRDVKTQFTMAIDADTTVAPDAIERFLAVMADHVRLGRMRIRRAASRATRSGSAAATSNTCWRSRFTSRFRTTSPSR